MQLMRQVTMFKQVILVFAANTVASVELQTGVEATHSTHQCTSASLHQPLHSPSRGGVCYGDQPDERSGNQPWWCSRGTQLTNEGEAGSDALRKQPFH